MPGTELTKRERFQQRTGPALMAAVLIALAVDAIWEAIEEWKDSAE